MEGTANIASCMLRSFFDLVREENWLAGVVLHLRHNKHVRQHALYGADRLAELLAVSGILGYLYPTGRCRCLWEEGLAQS